MAAMDPRKVSSPKSTYSDASTTFLDDPLMVACASDASTASTTYDDEPLRVELACYDFSSQDVLRESSDEQESAPQRGLAELLQNENKRLERENALLQMQHQSLMRLASQGMLGAYGMPSPAPGYVPPAWIQAQWAAQVMGAGVARQSHPSAPGVHVVPRAEKDSKDTALDADSEFGDCSSDAAEAKAVPRTSIMLRNLPNSYNRQLLIKLLDNEGFAGKYDFVYLPIDFKTRLSLAYAFINLTSAENAKLFWKHFHGFSNWAVPSRKVASVNWSEFQGLATHIDRYRSSPVMHEGVPDEFKPALFSGVERIPFPAPTTKVRAPRCRVRSKVMQPGRVG